MPIYDYHCDECGHTFSAVQSYTDATLEVCPSCGKKPRKLMATPAIVFKGGGWYKTDSRVTPKDGSKDGSKDGAADGGDRSKSDGAKSDGPKGDGAKGDGAKGDGAKGEPAPAKTERPKAEPSTATTTTAAAKKGEAPSS